MQFTVTDGVWSLLVCGSSLFIGLKNGDIVQWDQPGEVMNVLKGHTHMVTCLLQCGDVLWSGSNDMTMRLWNIQTGECMQTIETESAVTSLVCGENTSSVRLCRFLLDGDPFIRVWSTNGTYVDMWKVEEGGNFLNQTWNHFLPNI